MISKKATILLIVSFFISKCYFLYAGELAFEEAVNYYNEGVLAQKGGYFDDADTAYKKALMLDQDLQYYKYIMNNMGVSHIEQENLDGAELAFRKALSEDPEYIVARFNLGLVFYMKKDYPRALKHILKALEIDSVKLDSFTIEDEIKEKVKD